LTPDKATGGQWSELMSKMKEGVPEKLRKNLDSGTNRSGSKGWNG